MKKIRELYIIIISCSICLLGCGKGKNVNDMKDFKADAISEINVNLESWELKVDASVDERIHVSYNGTVKEGKSDIEILQTDAVLDIQQLDKPQNMAEQFSFGKPGEIIIYLPKKTEIPFNIQNGSGDMQIDNISVGEI